MMMMMMMIMTVMAIVIEMSLLAVVGCNDGCQSCFPHTYPQTRTHPVGLNQHGHAHWFLECLPNYACVFATFGVTAACCHSGFLAAQSLFQSKAISDFNATLDDYCDERVTLLVRIRDVNHRAPKALCSENHAALEP